jgi:protocatechuate 3,4-dioxygenase beta subunit
VDNEASQDLPWRGTIVTPDEPGEPLILSGTVYAPDGRTRVVGARVRIYHTDATGRYSRDGGDESRPRLQIVVQTNAEGRYEVRTIVPAAYPAQRSSPAHIHIMVPSKAAPNRMRRFRSRAIRD